jgi:hypothetical protein
MTGLSSRTSLLSTGIHSTAEISVRFRERKVVMDQNRSNFVLTGFSHDLGFRVFEFDGVDEARTRTHYTVRADLTLVRRHGVRIQELPLLCRRLLDASEAPGRSLTLSEAEMIACAEKIRNQAKARKPWQRPSDEQGIDESRHKTGRAR